MIPAASSVANTGTLGGPAKTMTIMRDAMAHIMSVLTNLYSNSKLAVLREYSTNALDAHREVGLNRPIEVTLPSDVKPTLSIEDYGVGMSTDDILNLYSSYGASTKRDTNEQTGMLGLGSKSALAYSPQFTVRSRKGGIETSALIYLNDKGEGEIKIVDTKATDATGTRIEIPVAPKDIRDFRKAAVSLFAFWKDEDVTVKGSEILRGYTDAGWVWINDDVALMPPGFLDESYRGYRYEPNKVYVVQGGVPYAIEKDRLSDEGKALYNDLPTDHYEVVLYAPIGSVQFTPSREAIYYTNQTNAAIENLMTGYSNAVSKFVTEAVAKSKTKQDAMRACEKYADITPAGTKVEYQGQIVPTTVEAPCFDTDTGKRASGKRRKVLPPLSKVESYDLVVYGATQSQLSDKGAYQLRVAAHGYLTGTYSLVDRYYGRGSHKNILIIEGDLPEGWDWYNVTAAKSDVLRPKSGRAKGGAAQAKTDYQLREWAVVGGTWGQTTKVDPADEKVVYVDADGRYKVKTIGQNGYTVVMVPGNQHGRFAREFPKAMTREQAIAKAAKDAKVVYTEADATNTASRLFYYLPTPSQIAQVLDKDLRTVLEWQSKKQTGVIKMEKINAELSWLNVKAQVVTAPTPLLDAAEKRYGFLSHIKGTDLIDTVNALYSYKYLGGTK